MDAGEKKSFRKVGDGEMSGKETMKVYYFPELPVKRVSDYGEGQGKVFGFERINVSGGGGRQGNEQPACEDTRHPDEEAQSRAKEIEKSAFIEGFSKGEKAGMEAGVKRVEPVMNSLGQCLSELARAKRELSLAAEKEIVDLAMAVARKVLCYEVSTDREVAKRILKEALKKVKDYGRVRVRMNPTDIEYLEQLRRQGTSPFEDVEDVVFIPDEMILNGGCIVETELGEIDARIDKQLEAIEEAFRAEYEKALPN